MVGIISENRIEFLLVIVAVCLTGATFTCFNSTYTVAELEHTLGITRPSIVFSSQRNQSLEQANTAVSCIEHIVLFDGDDDEVVYPTLRFATMIRARDEKLQPVKKNSESNVAVLYSSGTTGLPKGVAMSHKNLLYIFKIIRKENTFKIQKKETIINFAPLFHAYGLFLGLMSLILDARVVIMRKFDEILFLQNIEIYQVKTQFLVPPLVMFLLKNSLVDEFDLSSLENIICGAAPLKFETEQQLRQKFKLKLLQQAYGLTECTFIACSRRERMWKAGSSGTPACGTQIKIIDVDTGKALRQNESGEICIKGPQVTNGYYNNAEATAECFDTDGWLHSGDIGYYDEDGDIYVVDRRKELIKYKAHQLGVAFLHSYPKVPPAELESVLVKHEDVQDAGVIGIPNDLAGEIPAAFVVKKPGSTITERQLVDYVSALVSPPKRLRGGVIFIREIPKNPSGKILRRQLRKYYSNLKSKY